MAKPKKPAAAPVEPDPIVRLTAKMLKSQRYRLRIQAMRANRNIEDMATDWLMERLSEEERKGK